MEYVFFLVIFLYHKVKASEMKRIGCTCKKERKKHITNIRLNIYNSQGHTIHIFSRRQQQSIGKFLYIL